MIPPKLILYNNIFFSIFQQQKQKTNKQKKQNQPIKMEIIIKNKIHFQFLLKTGKELPM